MGSVHKHVDKNLKNWELLARQIQASSSRIDSFCFRDFRHSQGPNYSERTLRFRSRVLSEHDEVAPGSSGTRGPAEPKSSFRLLWNSKKAANTPVLAPILPGRYGVIGTAGTRFL